MKIGGSESSNDSTIKRLQDGKGSDQGVGRTTMLRGGSVSSDSSTGLSALIGSDSISVSSLGALLRNELDPEKLAAERKEKLAALKQQIQDGTYQPSTEVVAAAVSEELSFEILLGGGKEAQNDNELL